MSFGNMRTYFLLGGGEKCVFVNIYVFWDIYVEISWNMPFAKVEH